MKAKKSIFIIVLGTVFLIIACQGKQHKQLEEAEKSIMQENNTNSDSLQLAELIKNVLKWHEMDTSTDFDVTTNSPGDSIYNGIDWGAYNQRVKYLSESNFFTDDFLDNYKKIALYLDNELKQNSEKYFVGEIPPYSDESNNWCNCQDYPDKWEERLMLSNLKIDADSASFSWKWDEKDNYLVKAKKVNNSWKISFLEGFDIKRFSW